ncbi:hypothetical protein DL240_15675 [Lujinxingia litoralis]|uniref:Lipoprotein n=1 Tax=Lujinxingia litoralis TaxID=2211119 RepID=A0A328C4J7_9DELT|nr:hypothetical protein [Lujinxingia litoralis]RAL20755.1 hypothetical protein DL240_15675 [Lujinxingia litoralis]
MMRARMWWKVALLALVSGMAVGCAGSATYRDATFTHWHDEETVIVVYERQQSSGVFDVDASRTTHVRVCKVQEGNALLCRDQLRLANMLNPHMRGEEDLSDPWSP